MDLPWIILKHALGQTWDDAISPNIFPQELILLSSAKLHISGFKTKKSISFTKMLNKNGLE